MPKNQENSYLPSPMDPDKNPLGLLTGENKHDLDAERKRLERDKLVRDNRGVLSRLFGHFS